MLTLLDARKIANAAVLRAQELNLAISVAVCDPSGRLIVLNQMERSVGWQTDRSSMGKAVAAATTGRASHRLFDHLGAEELVYSSTNVVPPRGQRGGLPVVKSGVVEGGCGVSGAFNPALDEECARAGIEALSTVAAQLIASSA